MCGGVTEGNKCDAYEYPIPPWLTAIVDYTWFACLPLSPIFLPPMLLKPEGLLIDYKSNMVFVNGDDGGGDNDEDEGAEEEVELLP